MINIQKWCGSSSIYQRGVSYFRQGRVVDLQQDLDAGIWYATVAGSQYYNVEIEITSRDIEASCDCPAFANHWACKHIVAVLLEIEQIGQVDQIELFKANKETPKPETGKPIARKYFRAGQIIDSFANLFIPEEKDKSGPEKQVLNMEYIFKRHYAGGSHLLNIELKAGGKRLYVVKKIHQFLKCLEENIEYCFTSNFTLQPSDYLLSEEDQAVIAILQEIRKQEEFFHRQQDFYFPGPDGERSLAIPPTVADQLLTKLQGRNVSFEERSNLQFLPYSKERELPFDFQLGKGPKGDFKIDLTSLRSTMFYAAYDWLIHNNNIYKLSSTQKELLNNLYYLLREPGDSILQVEKSQMQRFVSHVIPGLKHLGRVEIDEQVSDQIISPALNIKMFVDLQDERILAKIEYHYGDTIIDPFQTQAASGTKEEMILMRNVEKEREMMKALEGTPLKYNGKECYLTGEDLIYEFLYISLPKLQDQAEVYLSSSVRALLLPKQSASMTKIDINSEGNLLEISFNLEGIDRQEVQQLLQSVVEKKKYYRLPSGAFVSLEDEAFQTVNQLFTDLHINKTQLDKDTFQLPVYRGLQIEGIMNGVKHNSIKLGKQFRRLIQDLKNFDTIEDVLPAELNATLRDYQQIGFQWLKTMARYGLGGILADDMGLGKTLQAITYLLSEKSEHKETKTSLVVAPASLVYNWKNEFEKFAPTLEVVVVYGAPDERAKLLTESAADVLITSYPLLRQDLEAYQDKEFASLILDEAQAIKNHQTKTAKAVKQLKAVKRFALSGTPIENSLDELWSIFDAIQPGFFQNQRSFSSLSREKLARMVRPFILRRVKQDVLRELPEKIETVHQSELTKAQKELYLGYLEKIRQETKDSLLTEGFEKSRIKILAGLTRLRQLCCHPALFLENYKDQSGKLDHLMELIENALENKRRLLVFSQFASMLRIIREELDKMKLGYFYLDGQTPSKERVAMTERFNTGENALFLISLKAGGTGLNLTGADTVILYDLWWNPAVEEQAAGRAHRMGQKNCVQVMRLITKGTIEEKIYEMQQRKKELIEQVIQPGEAALSSLSEEDLKEILGI